MGRKGTAIPRQEFVRQSSLSLKCGPACNAPGEITPPMNKCIGRPALAPSTSIASSLAGSSFSWSRGASLWTSLSSCCWVWTRSSTVLFRLTSIALSRISTTWIITTSLLLSLSLSRIPAPCFTSWTSVSSLTSLSGVVSLSGGIPLALSRISSSCFWVWTRISILYLYLWEHVIAGGSMTSFRPHHTRGTGSPWACSLSSCSWVLAPLPVIYSGICSIIWHGLQLPRSCSQGAPGGFITVVGMLALASRRTHIGILVVLVMLFVEWHLFDFGGNFYRKLYISSSLRVRYYGISLTSRLASTLSTSCTRRAMTTSSTLPCIPTYSIVQCMIRMLRKPPQRLACSPVRAFGAIASVVGQSLYYSEFLRLCRGPLPALMSCSQLPAVRCAVFFSSIIIYWSPMLGHILLHTARYMLMLIFFPWFLHLYVRRGFTNRCRGSLARLARNPRCAAIRKSRRGARGRGLANATQVPPDDSTSAKSGPSQPTSQAPEDAQTYDKSSCSLGPSPRRGTNGTFSLSPRPRTKPSSERRIRRKTATLPSGTSRHSRPTNAARERTTLEEPYVHSSPTDPTQTRPHDNQMSVTAAESKTEADSGVSPEAQIRMGWWNIEHISTVWFDEQFWDILEAFHIVFLTETHHTELPAHPGWRIIGQVRTSETKAGGILVLVRDGLPAQVEQVTYPFDDFVWLYLIFDNSIAWWVGGAYFPGPSDPRFRAQQGDGREDQFSVLAEQLRERVDQIWFLGGDFNGTTGTAQPLWGADDHLDATASDIQPPRRGSEDHRPVNAHGRRLLEALTDRGIILNGIQSKAFSESFTRSPQRAADCPGVIDYIVAPMTVLKMLPMSAFQVHETPPDFSDHHLTGLTANRPSGAEGSNVDASLFSMERLQALKIPETAEQWSIVDAEISESAEWGDLATDLETFLNSPTPARRDSQRFLDTVISKFTSILYDVFRRHRLVKHRSFTGAAHLVTGAQHAAPQHLRDLRSEASAARREYLRACKEEWPHPAVAEAKRQWNVLNARCRSTARSVRIGFRSNWRTLWDNMKRTSPSRFWRTFKSFTATQSEIILCTPDEQWRHWAEQGDVAEAVWNERLSGPAMEWVEELRRSATVEGEMHSASQHEVRLARARIRSGRAAGHDGVPPDVLRGLPCLLPFAHMLFNVILRTTVYPTAWGIGLIRSLLKPGKPPGLTTSLRGIRLLSSMASWFGRVLDQRARNLWSPCPEQFGFRQGAGCIEGVMVLIALIHSRISRGRRVYVLWVDLRTAFPSLNRAILIRRLFECGLGIAFCRLVLAALDSTVSILCIGKLLGCPFSEKLGVREGGVESPYQFNMYIDEVKRALESKHPNLCRLGGCIIALLLYADDAAIPGDTPEDLQLAADIFEQFCNDHHLFISVPKSYITVFHSASDTGVVYGDGGVLVEGERVNIQIYGQVIEATSMFKYLGVYINEFGNPRAHFQNRSSLSSSCRRFLGRICENPSALP